ncbi:biosynthetic-type acetolactate synthase large subunit [Clostridium pasteurianum]|uniref:Acetolactate synthase n=1 Tax=Clostridium pasteurianum BC1 TaxID=86416 RepID=R4K5X5_CLOPA|nr:biosynthetic-type acetolactate synthase large subunit [Clostridium pasteurianum]AGK97101.1 acetolactate synthase, large subunit, biosynthetic type [Clostridium pasteurianum BC1]
MKLSGAQVLLECLKEQGVDVIFGYPGGAVLPIYDALYHEKEIKHILTAHEQGATHAADGYARATGKVGVVIATSGPGATNTVTGIATAFSDSIPLVVITGQVGKSYLGKSSFQEVDITSITKAITKENYIVQDPESLSDTIRRAFKIASTGRPGPVLIDIPKDIQNTIIDHYPLTETVRDILPEAGDLSQAINLIKASKKPVIFAGGGVISSNASKELYDFAKKIQCPVSCSLMGLGGFPGDDQLFLGMVGMHGTYTSNYAFSNCDLLIAIGSRFSDRVTGKVSSFVPNAKIIHIDIDASEFSKNLPEDVSIRGDVKTVLTTLISSLENKCESQWLEQINLWKKSHPLMYKKNTSVNPQILLDKLHKFTEGNCIVTTEVGQNQMWTAQFFKFLHARSFITSGGLGTMGFGLGAAIGACIGSGNKKVINVAGDGSFRMNCNELATLAKYKLPVIQLVLNNHVLGMVYQWQDMFYNKNFSQTVFDSTPDFCKLAAAYGIKSFKISSNDEIDAVLETALSLNEPVIIDCEILKEEKVLPIVPPGAANTDLIELED